MNPHPAIFCVGQNYSEHAKEMGNEGSTEFVLFMKNPASIISNGEDIVIPSCCENEVDYEGELAVIIGRNCKIGKGTKIWHWTHICKDAIIGDYCSIGQNVFIGNKPLMERGIIRQFLEYRPNIISFGSPELI